MLVLQVFALPKQDVRVKVQSRPYTFDEGLMTQLTFPLATMLAFCRIIRKPDAGKF